MKKKNIIVIILILFILIVSIGFILYFSNNKDSIKLKKLGYNNLEVNEILKLSDNEVNVIINNDYNKNLMFVLSSESYNKDKLDLYLKYINKYNNIDYLKIFNLINNKDTNQNKLDDYIILIKDYDNVEAIIKYVNNYKDKNIKLDNTTLSLINEKYFVYNNLDRYIKYIKENDNLEFKEVITRVNSNLDYKFYDDSKEADLSKGMYTLVNKYFYLKNDYIPENLVTVDRNYSINNTKLNKDALDNFIKLSDKAKENNLTLKITTAYRDYNFQSILYNNYVNADGVKNADTYSARPGYSEHQLGYSVDLTNTTYSDFGNFENTEEYKWLLENAHKYGFIQRYPKDKEYITGYQFESWHYRYVGNDVATYIYENDITYEEYYEYFLR